MKTIVAAVLAAIISSSALSEELEPKTHDKFHLQISGYGQGVWSNHSLQGDKHRRNAKWQKLVTDFDLRTPIQEIMFFGEVDFWNVNQGNAWLEQAFIQINVIEKTTLRLGRVYLSGGHVTPLPDHLETVHYPEIPYSIYGNGAQLETKLGDSYKITIDITTQTSSHDSHGKTSDKVEMSANATRSFESVNLTVAGQISTVGDFKIYGINMDWRPSKSLHSKGALYVKDDKTQDHGGYLFLGYEFFDHIEAHGQVDHHTDKKHSSTVWTKGLRIFPNKKIEITLDHESIFSQKHVVENRVLTRLQIRF